ncbi:hypothetical protein KCP74_16605 [Salmonella enterica subsp. enterica]|nr:hypothetical protein KCP74_16605 [Salmonella enterica subsp. enterica]
MLEKLKEAMLTFIRRYWRCLYQSAGLRLLQPGIAFSVRPAGGSTF